MSQQIHRGAPLKIHKIVATAPLPRSLHLEPTPNSQRVILNHLTDLKLPLKKGDLPWNIALVCACCSHVLHFSFGLQKPDFC